MRNEFTAVVERAGRWPIACCPEIPVTMAKGGRGPRPLKSLANAIALILEDRRKDGLRGGRRVASDIDPGPLPLSRLAGGTDRVVRPVIAGALPRASPPRTRER